MIKLREGMACYLSLLPIDMRKSIDGLSILVAEHLKQSPQDGSVYIFYNRARDKVKLIYWDRNGFVLHYKRLSKGKFKCSINHDSPHVELSSVQLEWLLAGLDFVLMSTFDEINYTHYF